MSLKLISVRVPESTRKYLKHKAVADGTTVQEVVNTIFTDYQSKDSDYIAQLNNMGLTSFLQVTQGANYEK